MRVMGWILVGAGVVGFVVFLLRGTTPAEPHAALTAIPGDPPAAPREMQESPPPKPAVTVPPVDASARESDSPITGGELEDTGTRQEALVQQLRSSDNEAVFRAALELAKLGASEAIAPLSRVLREHKDFYARLGAATALGTSGSPDAVGVLIQALGDREDLVRLSANESLQQITKHKLSLSPGQTQEERAELQRKWRVWWDVNESGVRARTR